jgi:hypothetical protein
MSETKDLSLGYRSCFERDGVVSRDVVEHLCTSDRTGQEFTAFVCTRCLEVGRETRVTCRTFGHVANRT